MRKSFKFRIYPTSNQEVKLITTLTTCRHLYNDALGEIKEHSKNIKFHKDFPIYQDFDLFPWGIRFDYINYYDQQRDLPKNKTEFQKQVYGHVLQNVLRRVEKSYKKFFDGAGYPRFQGRNRYDSFTYPDPYGIGYKITDDGKLKLSKIGIVKIIQHREIEGKIKTCTIKRDGNQWYASFSCDVEPELLEPTGQSIGIDVGLKSLVTLSDGKQIAPPKYLRQSEEKLTKAQKSLSNKKKGSSNRNKQRIEVARIHRKIRNQREDFNHKLSREIVNNYDLIVFEDLRIKNMVKNHKLAKSISDASWGKLIDYTSYKAEYAGRTVELVNPRNTSKMCSTCGHIQDMPLSQRIYTCSCGNVMDRDHNAAINILRRAVGTTVQACGGNLNRDLMKQEAPSARVG